MSARLHIVTNWLSGTVHVFKDREDAATIQAVPADIIEARRSGRACDRTREDNAHLDAVAVSVRAMLLALGHDVSFVEALS